MANPKNEQSVNKLRDILAEARTFFLIDYQGLSAGELGDLRQKVREAGGRVFITKNTLINVVLKEKELDDLEEILKGPTAMVLVDQDPVAPARAITDFAKASPKELPRAKGGLLSGKSIDAAAIKRIIDLPSREQLLGSLLGTLQAPLQQLVTTLESPPRDLVTALEGVPRNLVNVLNNYSEKLKENN